MTPNILTEIRCHKTSANQPLPPPSSRHSRNNNVLCVLQLKHKRMHSEMCISFTIYTMDKRFITSVWWTWVGFEVSFCTSFTGRRCSYQTYFSALFHEYLKVLPFQSTNCIHLGIIYLHRNTLSKGNRNWSLQYLLTISWPKFFQWTLVFIYRISPNERPGAHNFNHWCALPLIRDSYYLEGIRSCPLLTRHSFESRRSSREIRYPYLYSLNI